MRNHFATNHQTASIERRKSSVFSLVEIALHDRTTEIKSFTTNILPVSLYFAMIWSVKRGSKVNNYHEINNLGEAFKKMWGAHALTL
jgi:hypothetical protein